jgi:hypothetical protein
MDGNSRHGKFPAPALEHADALMENPPDPERRGR